MKRFPLGALALSALLLPLAAGACATPGPDTTDDSADAEAEVRAAYDDFVRAWEAESADAVVAFFTDDAVAFDPVPPGRWEGASDIREGWVAPSFDFLDDISIDSRMVRVNTRGDVAWVTSAYTFTATTADGPFRDEGNLSMVWVRQADGGWRVAVFHASPPVEG